MNPATIKAIDKWIGQPVCFFLTIFSYLAFLNRRTQPVKKILFLKLIEQGATVLAYSAIKRAAGMVGRENLYFCVFKENRPILDVIDVIPPENVMVIRQNNLLLFIADVLGFIIKSRKAKINTTIDMEFFSRASAILAYLSGASNRVGLHRFTSEYPYRGNLMTHRVQYSPYLHTAISYLLLVEALSHDPDTIPLLKIPADLEIETPQFRASEEEKQKTRALLTQKSGIIPNGKIILLNPNASDMLPLRKWPVERFIELAKKIQTEYMDALIVITGAPSEQQPAEEIKRKIGGNKVISLAGSTSLREVITLYTIADILVTNDSGPGHFSSMTNISTIVLFGPETPVLFAPKGKNVHVIWKKLSCSPCVNVFNHRFSPCNDNVCMKSIEVEEVFAKVKECIA